MNSEEIQDLLKRFKPSFNLVKSWDNLDINYTHFQEMNEIIPYSNIVYAEEQTSKCKGNVDIFTKYNIFDTKNQ